MTPLETRPPEMHAPEATESAQVGSAAPGGRRGPGAVAVSVALTALIVALLGLAGAVTVAPRVMGAVPLTVLTPSMQPALAPGDLVVVRPTPAEEIRPGDVITFQPESDNPALVTHRVVGITAGGDGSLTGFITQGDDNDTPDEPIVAEQVKGRVVYSVPFVGHLTNASWAPQVAVVLGVGLLGYGLVTIVLGFRNRTEEKES